MADKKVSFTLRKRLSKNNIQVDLNVISELVEANNKEALFSLFKNAVTEPYVHDVHWLKLVINWTPEGGLALTEMLRWAELAKVANKLDDTQDKVVIEIDSSDAQQIIDRLKDSKFKMNRFSNLFIEFLEDFQSQTGFHLPI